MTTNEMYQQLGISPEVLDFGQRVLDGLDEEMSRVDDIAEYNQAKVLSAMHKNRLNATHFNLSSGYGYDDEGRDNLERVYGRRVPHGGGAGSAPDHLRHPCAGTGAGGQPPAGRRTAEPRRGAL